MFKNKCKRYRRKIVEKVLGELNDHESRILHQHFEYCENCHLFYKELRQEDKVLCAYFKPLSENVVSTDYESILSKASISLKKAGVKSKNGIPISSGIVSFVMKELGTFRGRFKIAGIVSLCIIACFLFLFLTKTDIAIAAENVLKAIQDVKWMHCTYEINENRTSINSKDLVREYWLSSDPHYEITVYCDGSIYLNNESSGWSENYDPLSNVLRIQNRGSLSPLQKPKTLNLVVEESLLQLMRESRDVKYAKISYLPRSLMAIETNYIAKNGIYYEILMTVDNQTKLPVSCNILQRNEKDETCLVSLQFEYPQSGPTSIFDMDIPTNVKVIDESNAISKEVLDIMRLYEENRRKLPQRYIVLEMLSGPTSFVKRIFVQYKEGKKERIEERFLSLENVNIPDMSKTNALLDWIYSLPVYSMDIQLYDGEKIFLNRRDPGGSWTITEPGISYVNSYVGGICDRSWPIISVQGSKIIENEISHERNLICIEKIIPANETGKYEENEIDRRILYYLDPLHDYICVRQERYEKTVSTTKWVLSDVSETLEISQLSDGMCYTSKMEFRSKGKEDRDNERLWLTSQLILYVDEEFEFQQNTFDQQYIIKEVINSN